MFIVLFGGLFKDPWGNERVGFTISGKINRSDWGLIWNSPIEGGGVMLSDEVNISSEIQLVRIEHNSMKVELAHVRKEFN